jgi:hypothetical protein
MGTSEKKFRVQHGGPRPGRPPWIRHWLILKILPVVRQRLAHQWHQTLSKGSIYRYCDIKKSRLKVEVSSCYGAEIEEPRRAKQLAMSKIILQIHPL